MCITRRKQALHSQHHHQSHHLQPPLTQRPCDHHYKQTSPHPPLQEHDCHSIFTIEMGSRNLPRGSLHTDSEPLYQEIEERINYGSDGCENIQNLFDKTVCDKLLDLRFNCNERDTYMKTCEKAKIITKPSNPKPNIVYGVITAKEVAKYRPCTQDIILRPGILQ